MRCVACPKTDESNLVVTEDDARIFGVFLLGVLFGLSARGWLDSLGSRVSVAEASLSQDGSGRGQHLLAPWPAAAPGIGVSMLRN